MLFRGRLGRDEAKDGARGLLRADFLCSTAGKPSLCILIFLSHGLSGPAPAPLSNLLLYQLCYQLWAPLWGVRRTAKQPRVHLCQSPVA